MIYFLALSRRGWIIYLIIMLIVLIITGIITGIFYYLAYEERKEIMKILMPNKENMDMASNIINSSKNVDGFFTDLSVKMKNDIKLHQSNNAPLLAIVFKEIIYNLFMKRENRLIPSNTKLLQYLTRNYLPNDIFIYKVFQIFMIQIILNKPFDGYFYQTNMFKLKEIDLHSSHDTALCFKSAKNYLINKAKVEQSQILSLSR